MRRGVIAVMVKLLHVAAASPHQLKLSGSDTVPLKGPARFRCQISMSVSILFVSFTILWQIYWNLVNMARRYIHYMSPRRVDETCKLECNIYRRNSFRSCLHLQLRLVKVLDYVGILLDS